MHENKFYVLLHRNYLSIKSHYEIISRDYVQMCARAHVKLVMFFSVTSIVCSR